MAKTKLKSKYQNIPVSPSTYELVRLVAQSNNRGLGDQVKAWAEADLPDCGHDKVMVTVETYPSAVVLQRKQIRKAWYCATCKRVYAVDPNALEGLAVAKQETIYDPYGQPIEGSVSILGDK